MADKYFMTDAELAAEQALGHDKGGRQYVAGVESRTGQSAIGDCSLAGRGHSLVVGRVGDGAEDGSVV